MLHKQEKLKKKLRINKKKIFNVLKKLTNSSFKIHVVKLEELHKESEKILK